jgi:hypothetical protein
MVARSAITPRARGRLLLGRGAIQHDVERDRQNQELHPALKRIRWIRFIVPTLAA